MPEPLFEGSGGVFADGVMHASLPEFKLRAGVGD
jgi:hypothetical protein